MNPMTNVKNIKKLSEQDIRLGGKSSWHNQYKDSAWIFIGGLPYDLTEGDIICVFSQYGEVVNINLVRDKESGKQKGFCFLCYEDQRSTILAVDNLNSSKILGRTLRVDHVENYKAPKEGKKNPIDDETRQLREEGCAPSSKIATQASSSKEVPIKTEEIIVGGVRLPLRLPIGPVKTENSQERTSDSKKSKKKDKIKNKSKKEKKSKESKKRKRKPSTSSSDSETSSSSSSDSQSSQSEDDDRHKSKKKRR